MSGWFDYGQALRFLSAVVVCTRFERGSWLGCPSGTGFFHRIASVAGVLCTALGVSGADGLTLLAPDGSGSLLSYAVTLEKPAFSDPYLSFELGFTTEEATVPARFLDSVTLTLQNQAGSVTSLLLTQDVGGEVWGPTGEGTVAIPPERIQHGAAAWPGGIPTLPFAVAHRVVVPIAIELAASPMSLYVDVFDNQDALRSKAWIRGVVVLPGQPVQISGAVNYYAGGGAISGVGLGLSGDNVDGWTTGGDGRYQFQTGASGTYTITPTRGDQGVPSQGVTTLDITLIRRHILALALLDSPYKLLAADVNGSGAVTTLDITLIRRVILGLAGTFPAGLWTFVPSDAEFANAQAPWGVVRHRSYHALAVDTAGQGFVGIKLGDVNGSWLPEPPASPPPIEAAVRAPPTLMGSVGEREGGGLADTSGDVRFWFENANVSKGETFRLPLRVGGFSEVTSAQFTVGWDPAVLEFEGVTGGSGVEVGQEHFGSVGMASGVLCFSWDDVRGGGVTLGDGAEFLGMRFRVVGHAEGSTPVRVIGEVVPVEVSRQFEEAKWSARDGLVWVTGDVGPPRLRVMLGRDAVGTLTLGVTGGVGPVVVLQETRDFVEWKEVDRRTRSEGLGAVEWRLPMGVRSDQRFYRVLNPL